MREREKGGVARGVVILSCAAILVKVIGVFYKVPLSYILGDEGMGYFNAAYSVYAWLYMLSTAGIPIALSILVSEARTQGDREKYRRIVRVSFSALFTIGLVTSLAMTVFSRGIARLLGNEDAALSVIAIAPTLFLVSLISFFRGCFQGFSRMAPTAVSQVIEAIGRLGFGVLLSLYASRRGYSLPRVAGYGIFGVTAGTVLSFLYLIILFASARRRGVFDFPELVAGVRRGVVGRLFRIALPVTVSASVMSLTGLADLALMIRRLSHAGFSTAEATALFGNYTTLVVPIANLPSILIYPIATGIIPAISGYHADGLSDKIRETLDGAFRVTALVAFPSALGFAFLARPILGLLFAEESVTVAYRVLSASAPSVLFLCFLTIANAALQATGQERVPMWSMLAGGAVKVVSGYFLIGTPSVGILGAPVGTALCYATALMIDLFALTGKAAYTPRLLNTVIKPLLAAAVSVGFSAYAYYAWYDGLVGRFGILAFVALAAVLFSMISWISGLLTTDDFRILLHRKKSTEST